ncbi:MAG TPA: endolytic transglycosylase MltG [Xanthobacteraceae bacterium]
MLWRRKSGASPDKAADEAAPADRVPEPDTAGAPEAGPQPQPEKKRIQLKSPRAALEPERVPMPTRRSASARHPMVVAGNAVFTILIMLAIAAGAAVMIGKSRFDARGPLAEDKVVIVPRAGIREVADVLEREGVIDQPWSFVVTALVMKARGGEVKAGEYQFPKQASLQEVIGIISEGKVVQHAITIPEGLTSEQIVQRLLEADVLTGNIREVPREGSLLPETYRFPRGTPREQVIQRLQQAQRRLVMETWERRASDLPLKSPEELVTLASIIEKETGRPEERSRVAAVFVNRLKQKMRLQSDPTIIYGLVGGKGSLGRPIMRNEIVQPTPYNTYTIDGLPPGPIANPGRASIEAAANPARTKEVYFVADGNGGHAFAENLDQHQKNVAKLRELEQQQNGAASPATAEESASPPSADPPPTPMARPRRPAPPRQLAPPAAQSQNQTPRARAQ